MNYKITAGWYPKFNTLCPPLAPRKHQLARFKRRFLFITAHYPAEQSMSRLIYRPLRATNSFQRNKGAEGKVWNRWNDHSVNRLSRRNMETCSYSWRVHSCSRDPLLQRYLRMRAYMSPSPQLLLHSSASMSSVPFWRDTKHENRAH